MSGGEDDGRALPVPRHFGRRHGRRLRAGRQERLETLLPRLSITVPAAGETLNFLHLFGSDVTDVWLEIGFGAGEHLAALAARHPRIGFIGCEPYVNGVANLLALLERDNLDNVRVFNDDALLLLSAIPEASLGCVMLLFPDPWPKKRHAARRFVSRDSIDRLAHLLREGAEFRFASDDAAYARWTLDLMDHHPAFVGTHDSPIPWQTRPPDWPPTRYEEKARTRGACCAYLSFVRRSRTRAR